jgi:hypothetical protein
MENKWIDEHDLDLIGYTLVFCGIVLIIKGLFFCNECDGGLLGLL